MQHAFGREINHRVAIGVAAADVLCEHFLASQKNLGLIGEGDAREPGHLSGHHVGACVLVDDDLGRRCHQRFVAAGMVGVLMGVEDVADGLVADGFHFSNDFGCVRGELIIHQQDALRGWHGCDISTVADDDV